MRQQAIQLISLSILILLVAGCTERNSVEYSSVSIDSTSDIDQNVTVIIKLENNEIYNETFLLKAHNYSQYLCKIDTNKEYYFKIFTDKNLSYEETKTISSSVVRIAISISNDKIQIFIKVT